MIGRKRLLIIDDYFELFEAINIYNSKYRCFNLFYCNTLYNLINNYSKIRYDICICDWLLWEKRSDDSRFSITGEVFMDCIKAKRKYFYTNYSEDENLRKYAIENNIKVLKKTESLTEYLNKIVKGEL